MAEGKLKIVTKPGTLCVVWPPYTCFPPTLARPQILSLVALNKDLAGYATRMTGRVAGPILPPANAVTMCSDNIRN